MKKLIIIVLFLLLGGAGFSQTYQADSLVYYSSAYNMTPDTILHEDIKIVIERGTLTITKHNARFHAIIEDTLPEEKTASGITDRIFKLRTYPTMYQDDTGYALLMIISYFDNKVIALGLLHKEQLFIYHIVNQLIDGQAARKPKYFDDWLRTAFSGE